MRLSEAMRKGATFRPQCRGAYFLQQEGQQMRSCALGAAAEALFGVIGSVADRIAARQLLTKQYPELSNGNLSCPVCGEESWATRGLVSHLNDGHRWTRERIADHLDFLDGIPTPQELG